MNVEKHIPELLALHDCVIVPGFGGFVAGYASARIQPVHHTFHPPFKSILFNVSLRRNDGLLANRIAQSENTSFLDALRAIAGMTDRWNRLLTEGRPVEIPEVGVITRDAEGNLQFEQDLRTNYLPDAYGLTSFVSPAISRLPEGRKTRHKVRKIATLPVTGRRTVPAVLKWAAILALPVGIVAVMSLTGRERVRNLALNYSGLIWSVTSSHTPSKPPEQIPPVAAVKRTIVTPPSVMIPVHPAPSFIASTEDLPFALIVGAFRVKENADRLVARLRGTGYDARITDRTGSGLHRVAMRNYATRKEAIAGLNMARSGEFPGAWILRKNK